MKEIHIIPKNDLFDHEGVTCGCQPRVDYPSDDCILITHYAYDKRNRVEDLVEELAVELNYGDWEIIVIHESLSN